MAEQDSDRAPAKTKVNLQDLKELKSVSEFTQVLTNMSVFLQHTPARHEMLFTQKYHKCCILPSRNVITAEPPGGVCHSALVQSSCRVSSSSLNISFCSLYMIFYSKIW